MPVFLRDIAPEVVPVAIVFVFIGCSVQAQELLGFRVHLGGLMETLFKAPV